MRRLTSLIDRLVPALLMAASVTLLAAGLLSYSAPSDAGTGRSGASARPFGPAASIGPADPDPGEPSLSPSAPAVATATPLTSPPSPSGSLSPIGSPSFSPAPSVAPVVAVATRVVIPSQAIDLPIVSRDLRVVDQGPDRYPPCDVAVYHTAFSQPGQPGTTYLYGHARDGMFLPLLTASEKNDGQSLLGELVQVYTDDDRLYVYQITLVKRHATDFSVAFDVPEGSSQLVVQTSEGPRGTVGKLQIVAEPLDVLPASDHDAHPKPHPRACYTTP